jgi:hypothetical protein
MILAANMPGFWTPMLLTNAGVGLSFTLPCTWEKAVSQ